MDRHALKINDAINNCRHLSLKQLENKWRHATMNKWTEMPVNLNYKKTWRDMLDKWK